MPHATENPFQSSSIELLVVHDEDVGFLQGDTSASGGGMSSLETGPWVFKRLAAPFSRVGEPGPIGSP